MNGEDVEIFLYGTTPDRDRIEFDTLWFYFWKTKLVGFMYFGTHAERFYDFRPDALGSIKKNETLYQKALATLGQPRSVKTFPAISESNVIEVKYGYMRNDPANKSMDCRNVVLILDLDGLIRSVTNEETVTSERYLTPPLEPIVRFSDERFIF